MSGTQEVLPSESQGRSWLAQLLSQHPEARFLGAAEDRHAWDWVPAPIRGGYTKQAFLLAKAMAAGTATELSTLRSAIALGWELACVRQALSDGETLSASAQRLKTRLTGYPRYAKHQTASDEPLPSEERLLLQNDVPVVRAVDGEPLPYLVECKSSQTYPFGQDYGINVKAASRLSLGTLNQLLRYQAAIEHGLVAGASVEISGRIHPLMLRWMLEGLGGQGSRIPDVEVIWSCPLPSGSHARVCLKAGRSPGRWSPPISPLDPVDQKAWDNLQACLGNVSILEPLCLGQPSLSGVGDARRRSLLSEAVTAPSGHMFQAIERPWEIQGIEAWRAFVHESHAQTAQRLLQVSPRSRPSVRIPSA